MEELNPMQQPVEDEMPQNIVPETNTENTPMSDNASAAEAPEPAAIPTEPVAETTVEAAAEPETDYTGMSREELFAALNELMQNDVQKIKERVGRIRNEFNSLTKEIQKANYEAFIAGGGLKEDYQEVADALSNEFHKLYEVYRQRKQQFQEDLEAQKRKNHELKLSILEELRQLIDRDEENIKKTYDEFNVIQDKWKAIGDVPRDVVNDLWQNYHFLIEQFFNKIKISKELRMLDLKRNLEQKVLLCEQAEELIVETSITKAFKGLQDLREKWREIGPVPTEQNEEIWQRFCTAANKIDERRKEYYDQRKEEQDRNLLAKQALVEKADELTQTQPDNVKAWNETTDQLDELLKVWKTIGPVPKDVNDEIWTKFKSMIDNFYNAKKEFFNKMRDEQSENYNKKIDLCLWQKTIHRSRRPLQESLPQNTAQKR